MEINKSWWASQSKGTKAGIIIGTIVVIAGVSYLIYRNANSDKPDKPSNEPSKDDKGGRPESPDTTSNDTTQNTGIENNNSGNTGGAGTSANNTALPNGGSGCAVVRMAFDRNYDYVKCAGSWYTRSKDNPANPAVKGSIPNWKSLADNKVSTDRLNVAYPKD